MEKGKRTEIKICGLTRPEEAECLNENHVDYGGFVLFHEKSRRCVSIEQAEQIMERLDASVKKVAVTVSPEIPQVREIEKSGFDILQIHGELQDIILNEIHIPVWRAINIKGQEEIKTWFNYLNELPEELLDKITGIVVDGAEAGGGKPFDYNSGLGGIGAGILEKGRKFVLAGGLKAKNVAEGMRLFSPEVVDVSSGVESVYTIKDSGVESLYYAERSFSNETENNIIKKDPDKVRRFCEAVRMADGTQTGGTEHE